jgi:hypothetical protein
VSAKTWDKFVASLQTLDRVKVRVGVLKGAGTQKTDDGDVDLVDLAVIHEFGTEDIPARPFVRGTFEDSKVKEELRKVQEKIIKAFLAGKIDEQKANALLGTWAANAIKNYVKQGDSPLQALAPATIAAKKSSRPLVDTGQLINSVSYEVAEGDG